MSEPAKKFRGVWLESSLSKCVVHDMLTPVDVLNVPVLLRASRFWFSGQVSAP